jgi:hypothetical protein
MFNSYKIEWNVNVNWWKIIIKLYKCKGKTHKKDKNA